VLKVDILEYNEFIFHYYGVLHLRIKRAMSFNRVQYVHPNFVYVHLLC